jgi:trehalose synthase
MTTIEPGSDEITLDRYVPLLGAEIEELHALARPVAGREVLMVNSTRAGGGVAELLNRLLPLLEELGLRPAWEVMTGDQDFHDVTKAFSDALHGNPARLPPNAFEVFRAYSECNRSRLRLDSEFVVTHDAPPVGLIDESANRAGRWIWHCHADLSQPALEVWNFLEPSVSRYRASIFSSPEFSRRLSIPQYLFYPAIDPLSDKNRELDPVFVESVLEGFGIDPIRPVITQISRFDRFKDPVGVVRAYRLVKRYFDCQLVLAGPRAGEDPEARAVIEETRQEAAGDPDVHILELPPASSLEINALQTGSTVIVQKSLREGFGLTVAEALWKKKPVVASAVGGIPVQVMHKRTGLLAYSIEGTAYQIRYLLSHPEIAERLGEQGHAHVREEFLITVTVKRYLTLLLLLLRS